jgi:hypothetical protein
MPDVVPMISLDLTAGTFEVHDPMNPRVDHGDVMCANCFSKPETRHTGIRISGSTFL